MSEAPSRDFLGSVIDLETEVMDKALEPSRTAVNHLCVFAWVAYLFWHTGASVWAFVAPLALGWGVNILNRRRLRRKIREEP